MSEPYVSSSWKGERKVQLRSSNPPCVMLVGFQNVKVVVHGGPGFFTHAIFEIEHQGEMGQHGTVDFYYIK